MSSRPNFNSRLDKLDRVLNSLREHEKDLRRIVERFEAILEKIPPRPEAIAFPDGLKESQRMLERAGDRDGVILISGNKTLLITREELPKILQSQLGKLVEYKVDTVEKRNALEKLLAVLERKERKRRTRK